MNLVECLEKNSMILPNYYKEPTIVDVVRTIYNYCGYQYKQESTNQELKQYIKNKKHILFILSDGMGSNLINSLSNESLLKRNKVKDIVTVCPTTTGCVLSSVATAEYPAIHGIIGWYNYNRNRNIDYYAVLFKDRKSEKNLKELGVNAKEIYVYESAMNKLKRKTTALFPETIVNSNFSEFTLKKNRMGYHSIEEAFQKAMDAIQTNIEAETFTYLYLPQIDSESHKNGVYSQEVYQIIHEIEKGIEQLNNAGIQNLEIILTADHGQINVTEPDITMDFEKYNQFFYALPGIDFGTATYYVKAEKEKEFIENFQQDYQDRMYLFKTTELIENNIFGTEKISPYMQSNLGEYISFCKKGAYYVNTVTNAEKYIGKIKGTHSGFSKEELTIPLIVMNQ